MRRKLNQVGILRGKSLGAALRGTIVVLLLSFFGSGWFLYNQITAQKNGQFYINLIDHYDKEWREEKIAGRHSTLWPTEQDKRQYMNELRANMNKTWDRRDINSDRKEFMLFGMPLILFAGWLGLILLSWVFHGRVEIGFEDTRPA